MVTEKQLMSVYNKVSNYENKLSNALGELGNLVSSIYDEEITADLCNGGEIEFHRPSFGYDDNEIAIRIEDVIAKLKKID